jgi:putative Mg2+ transporter-C (MgtC) family protein
MLEWQEIVLRLGIATAAGALIGLNRDLRGKPIGLRTLAVVGLATALAVALVQPGGGAERISDAASRVIQGILTGIGFLGAGVIVHGGRRRVHGLTSAACTWLTACIGVVCGAGQWRLVGAALVIAFVVLITGGWIERWAHRVLGGRREAASSPSPTDPA